MRKSHRRLLSWIDRALAVRAVAAFVSAQILTLAAPLFVRSILDQALVQQNYHLLYLYGAGAVVTLVAAAVLNAFSRARFDELGERFHHTARRAIFRHVQGLSGPDRFVRSAGDLSSRILHDTYLAKSFLSNLFPSLVGAVVTVVGTGVVLLVLTPTLAAIAAVPFLIVAPLGWRYHRRLHSLAQKAMEVHSDLHGRVLDGLELADQAQVQGRTDYLSSRFERSSTVLEETEIELSRRRERFKLAANVAVSLVLLASLLVGGHFVIAGSLSLGTLVVYYVYLGRALGPTKSVGGLMFGAIRARAAVERLEDTLDWPTASKPSSNAFEAPIVGLEADSVEFSYPTTENEESRPVLDGFSLSLEPGERVAVLGPSGAGKTTLLRLLLGLLESDEGAVCAVDSDGRSRVMNADATGVGWVGQDVRLIGGTMSENVALGRDVTDQEMERVLRLAALEDLVDEVGLDRRIGDRGLRLSGGQRRRVALARALLDEPSILLLDQFASDLENAVCNRIFEALREDGLSVLYVGHRIPAGMKPHRALWMERGRIQRVLSESPSEEHQAMA